MGINIVSVAFVMLVMIHDNVLPSGPLIVTNYCLKQRLIDLMPFIVRQTYMYKST